MFLRVPARARCGLTLTPWLCCSSGSGQGLAVDGGPGVPAAPDPVAAALPVCPGDALRRQLAHRVPTVDGGGHRARRRASADHPGAAAHHHSAPGGPPTDPGPRAADPAGERRAGAVATVTRGPAETAGTGGGQRIGESGGGRAGGGVDRAPARHAQTTTRTRQRSVQPAAGISLISNAAGLIECSISP